MFPKKLLSACAKAVSAAGTAEIKATQVKTADKRAANGFMTNGMGLDVGRREPEGRALAFEHTGSIASKV
ncbi:hypothetical protein GCM10028812_19110 [Ancylobacter sonchi]|uniref:hypothetical protein n=1 Tax=Ancylobacter sonchi TaxID=1937790 RepID=UPI001FECCCF6|nr:hypothetical protein [Ancylobacter sonchi]